MMLRIAFFVCVVIMVNSQVPPVIPVGSITEGPKTTAPPSVKDCMLPVAPGPCKALFPRFYFNTITDTCESFIYGGCYGNRNNFPTEQACRDICMA